MQTTGHSGFIEIHENQEGRMWLHKSSYTNQNQLTI